MKQTKFKQTELGEIPEDWNLKTVNSLVERANTGLDAIKRAPIVIDNTGIKCLRIQDVSQEKNYSEWGYCRVTDNNYKRFRLCKGDILIARTGASVGVNKILNSNFDAVFNNGLIRIKVNSEVLPLFLFYNFQSLRFNQYIDSISQGTSTQPNIQIKSLLGFNITLPDICEQQKIVSILASLNDKIELNRKMNKTLENVGSALFKRWFVDFEFPNKNSKPYKSSGGKMVDSEMGRIPEGWDTRPLSTFIEFVKGKKPKKTSEKQEAGYLKQILIETFDTGDFLYAEPQGAITCTENDVLMVMDGASSGRIEYGYSGIIGSTLSKISVKEPLCPEFLYFFLKTKERDIRENTTGTSIPHTDKKKIEKYCFLSPPVYMIRVFSNIASRLLSKILLNNNEIMNISQVRDSLLPRLMSGKLRVKYN